ncbi:MAG TPA: aromatic amino acid transport family protein, partial [Chlamydiales bacterium]|nr:aromatic amino acid transport family protein [Chlamydiales bacterium]
MKILQNYSPQLVNAIFLVAGCCIGAGMLALPVATAQAGFWPSLAMMALAWAAMTFTALCFIEAGFWMKKDDAHVISMSQSLLGKPGKIISWCLYLFICYASLVSYTAGCGHLVAKVLDSSKTVSCLLFAAIFGPLLATKHTTLGRANSIMFFLMALAYIGVISFGFGSIDTTLLDRHNWHMAPMGLPLLLTAFSFQTMVPSLHPYLNHHGPSLRIAVVAGTSIAF